MLGQILVTFIGVLVGVNLVPTIANTAVGVTVNSTGGVGGVNVTGAAASIVLLIPLFFILGIAIFTIQSSIAILAKMGF